MPPPPSPQFPQFTVHKAMKSQGRGLSGNEANCFALCIKINDIHDQLQWTVFELIRIIRLPHVFFITV